MKRETKARLVWVAAFAAIGYFIPVLFQIPYLKWHVFPPVARVLIPIVFLTMRVPVDPDWSMIAFLIAPANALLYGLIGLVISQVVASRKPPEGI